MWYPHVMYYVIFIRLCWAFFDQPSSTFILLSWSFYNFKNFTPNESASLFGRRRFNSHTYPIQSSHLLRGLLKDLVFVIPSIGTFFLVVSLFFWALFYLVTPISIPLRFPLWLLLWSILINFSNNLWKPT